MINFRTDLASERRELYQKANSLENEIDGIESRKRRNRWKHQNRKSKNNKRKRRKSHRKTKRKLYNNRHQKTKNRPRRRNTKIIRSTFKRTKKNTRCTHWQTRRNPSSRAWKYLCHTRCPRTKSNKWNRSNKTYNKLSATICKRRHKRGKCYITRSIRNNRNRNTRNTKRNSRQYPPKTCNSNRCTSLKKHRKNK